MLTDKHIEFINKFNLKGNAEILINLVNQQREVAASYKEEEVFSKILNLNILNIELILIREACGGYIDNNPSFSDIKSIYSGDLGWCFIEHFYPKYSNCDTIGYLNDLYVLLDDEPMEDSAACKIMHSTFGGRISEYDIQAEVTEIEHEVYFKSLDTYLDRN